MSTAERLLCRTPAPMIGRWSQRRHVGVVAYHGVPDQEAFRAQLAGLSRAHNFISAADLRAAFRGRPLPPNPLLITFDDGERSVLENGAPVLEDLGIAPLLFVVGALLDTDTPFWWDEVEALSPDGVGEVRRLKKVPDTERRSTIQRLRAAGNRVVAGQLSTSDLRTLIDAGFEIGNHTFDHPCLDMTSDQDVVDQVEQGHAALVDRGITPTAFAYPNGNLDPRAEPILEQLGYDLGFLFDHHHTKLDQPHLRLSRLRLSSNASPDRAELILSGLQGAMMRLRRRG